MNDIEIISPGSTVMIGEHKSVPATVIAAQILRGGQVNYLVGWWDGADREELWLSHHDMDAPLPSQTMSVKLSMQ